MLIWLNEVIIDASYNVSICLKAEGCGVGVGAKFLGLSTTHIEPYLIFKILIK